MLSEVPFQVFFIAHQVKLLAVLITQNSLGLTLLICTGTNSIHTEELL